MDSAQAPPGNATSGLNVDGGQESRDSDVLQLQELKRENAALRKRLTWLSEATLRISEDLDITGVLQEVVDSACSLTGAKYGVLLSYDDAGQVNDVVASGLTEDEIQQVSRRPVGLGLLGHLNEVHGPVRIADIAQHPSSVGFPANHPPMKTFMGMQIRHLGERLGNIFLTEKRDHPEFTSEDEEILVLFASQAAHAIVNARRYQEVQRAKADIETFFQISPVAIAVFDLKSGELLSYNREIVRLFGDQYSTETRWGIDLPHMTFRRIDGREIPLVDLPMNRVYQFGETIRAEELVVQMPDGRSVPVLLNGAPIYSEQGEITAAMFAFQDVTSLADMERVRAEFLGLVSEELRVPLTTIKGAVSALSDLKSVSGQTEPQQLLRIIDQQNDLMRGQVNSLVELTQISTGALQLSQEAVEVSDLVTNAIAEYRSGHSGTAVDAEVPDDIPPVMADRQRIGQVLNNLLFSVARHAPGSTCVNVTAYLIDIYVAISVSGRSSARPVVSDSQLEASQRLLQGILGPGVQDVTKVTGGETLALAMCRGIVEAHGGRMRVENADRLGAMTITFTLPVADEAPGDTVEEIIPAVTRRAEATATSGRETAKILLAIQDPRTLALARQALSTADYVPITCSSLNELDRLYAEERPQLLLLDLSSPSAGGIQAIRRLTEGYGIPIVVLSGQGDEENIGRAFEMGADDYIVKPFSPTELIARIKSTLRRQAAHVRDPEITNVYALGDVSVDYDGRTLSVSGSQVPLTATEYKLLHELSRNAGRILTQDELLHRVWGPEYTGEPQLLRSYVKSLRQKLGDNARRPSYIFTEHGIGYRMAKP